MAKIKITQVRSKIGACENQKRTLEALGLRKINATREHEDSSVIVGMIDVVKHLVKVDKL